MPISSASGGAVQIECHTGSASNGGITVAGPGVHKSAELSVFQQERSAHNAELRGRGEAAVATYVQECGTPRVIITIDIDARGPTGHSNARLVLRYPD